MPRPTFADPRTEFAFKRSFGSTEPRDVFVALLHHRLDLDGPLARRQDSKAWE